MSETPDEPRVDEVEVDLEALMPAPTEEQQQAVLEAFDELRAVGFFVAIIGRGKQIAIEIRREMIDPEELGHVLAVADRHDLRVYVFASNIAPITLQPNLQEAARDAAERQEARDQIVLP